MSIRKEAAMLKDLSLCIYLPDINKYVIVDDVITNGCPFCKNSKLIVSTAHANKYIECKLCGFLFNFVTYGLSGPFTIADDTYLVAL